MSLPHSSSNNQNGLWKTSHPLHSIAHSLSWDYHHPSIDQGAIDNNIVVFATAATILGSVAQGLPLPWATNSIPQDSTAGDNGAISFHHNGIATGLMTAAAAAMRHCWICHCCRLSPLPFATIAIRRCRCRSPSLPFAIAAICHCIHSPSQTFAITDIRICYRCHGPLNSRDRQPLVFTLLTTHSHLFAVVWW